MSVSSTELDRSAVQQEFSPNQIEKLASSPNPRRSAKGSISAWAALALVVFGGMLPRLNHIDKSIWSAEAWVANSVLADSYWHMFQYPTWLQTTPPLFLILERATVHIAGISVASFRAVPFALAILSLVLIAWLSRQILRPVFAVVCTTLVALSPPAVVFSKEVKQYSGDVTASCLLLGALWVYLERRDRPRFILLLAAFTVALFLSYPAVVFIPVAIALVALAQPAGKSAHALNSRLRRSGTLAALVIAICGLNYWFLVRPNTSALLTDYWRAGYPRFEHLAGMMRFYEEDFLGMFVYFYMPINTKDILKSVISSVGYIPLLLITVGIVAILVIGIRSLRQNEQHLAAFALCLTPLCVLFVLNLIRLYPVNSRRLTLFMLPCMALCTCIVLQSFWTAATGHIPPQLAARLEVLITFFCVVTVFVVGVRSDNWSNYWFEDEDTGGALSFVKSHMSPGDTIYVHASIEEPAKLYFQILHWQPGDVRYGNTGWGCCKRTPEPRPTDPNSIRGYVLDDFQRVMQNSSENLWLVFTGRDDGWPNLEKEEPRVIAGYLDAIGCQKAVERRFANEVVNQFVCLPSVQLAPWLR